MDWDKKYESNERIWGEQPSELAIAAVRYLQKCKLNTRLLSILDIGCGYGRDEIYFLDNLRCSILGIDLSEKAIDLASNAILNTQKKNVKFQRCDFTELKEDKYDIVFVSNLYHLLKKDERKELRKTISRTLKPNGLLFLSTFSVNDPKHCGKDIPSPNSFKDGAYRHLFTKEELVDDFVFLIIKELYEHEFYEPRAAGEVHHHISWILIGEGR